jgi:hypothetical protein
MGTQRHTKSAKPQGKYPSLVEDVRSVSPRWEGKKKNQKKEQVH